jgi:transposase
MMAVSGSPASNGISGWTPTACPHAIHVTTANVTDRAGALVMFKACKGNLTRVIKLLVDSGYRGDDFAAAVLHTIGASVEVVKRRDLHAFVVIPKRWVVDRSFAWLDKCRRLWKNCERKLNSSLQMVVLAFLVLLLRRS